MATLTRLTINARTVCGAMVALCCLMIGRADAGESADRTATQSTAAPTAAAEPAPSIPPALVTAWFRLITSRQPDLAAIAAQLDAHPELAQAWSLSEPDKPWNKPYTALHMAAAFQNHALCQLLIDHHASLDAQSRWTKSPLFWTSVAMGHWLVEHGAHTSICWYAFAGDLEQVNALLAKQPELAHARDSTGSTVLGNAVNGHALPVILALIASGADVNAVDHMDRSVLDIAIGIDDQATRNPDYGAVADALVAHGAHWDALAAAAHGELAELAAELDQHPELIHKRYGAAWGVATLLIDYACAGNHQDCVELLLARGAGINDLDGIGASPLHYACGHSSTLVTWLLMHGADPHVRDRRFHADPRGWASFYRNKDAVAAMDAVVVAAEKAKNAERDKADF